jgi:hypothetical protein
MGYHNKYFLKDLAAISNGPSREKDLHVFKYLLQDFSINIISCIRRRRGRSIIFSTRRQHAVSDIIVPLGTERRSLFLSFQTLSTFK